MKSLLLYTLFSGLLSAQIVINGGGSGGVIGPASSVDGDCALFSGTTGKLLKDSGACPTPANYQTSTVYTCIGTSANCGTPTHTLDVADAGGTAYVNNGSLYLNGGTTSYVTASQQLGFAINGGPGANGKALLALGNYGANQSLLFQFEPAGGVTGGGIEGVGADLVLSTFSTGDIIFLPIRTEAMRLKQTTGDLLLGTTTDCTFKLCINDTSFGFAGKTCVVGAGGVLTCT